MSGKGSAPRPYSVTQEEYEKRWDAIFAKDKEPAVEWQQKDLFCDHKVWTYDYAEDVYVCNECGTKAASPSAA